MTLPERDSDGKLPSYAWPGGYPVMYLDRENSVLCADCATKSLDDVDEVPQFKPVDFFIHHEGATEYCGQCGKEVESAYGDSDEEES